MIRHAYLEYSKFMAVVGPNPKIINGLNDTKIHLLKRSTEPNEKKTDNLIKKFHIQPVILKTDQLMETIIRIESNSQKDGGYDFEDLSIHLVDLDVNPCIISDHLKDCTVYVCKKRIIEAYAQAYKNGQKIPKSNNQSSASSSESKIPRSMGHSEKKEPLKMESLLPTSDVVESLTDPIQDEGNTSEFQKTASQKPITEKAKFSQEKSIASNGVQSIAIKKDSMEAKKNDLEVTSNQKEQPSEGIKKESDQEIIPDQNADPEMNHKPVKPEENKTSYKKNKIFEKEDLFTQKPEKHQESCGEIEPHYQVGKEKSIALVEAQKKRKSEESSSAAGARDGSFSRGRPSRAAAPEVKKTQKELEREIFGSYSNFSDSVEAEASEMEDAKAVLILQYFNRLKEHINDKIAGFAEAKMDDDFYNQVIILFIKCDKEKDFILSFQSIVPGYIVSITKGAFPVLKQEAMYYYDVCNDLYNSDLYDK